MLKENKCGGIQLTEFDKNNLGKSKQFGFFYYIYI
jgi:hypothetical protein